jgi:hypothetical protein
MFTHEKNIFFPVFLYFSQFNGFFRTTRHAGGQFSRQAQAIIASRIKVRYEIGKDNSKGTGYATGFATRTAHLVAFQVPIGYALQSLLIAGIDTRGFLAMAANSGEGSVFPQRGNAVILRMIKISAGRLTLLAFVTYV